MELELIDPTSRELVRGASEILAEMGNGHEGGKHPKAKAEFLQSTVEIITGICSTVREARADLQGSLDELRTYTEPRGLKLMCSGSHPFTDPATQEITDDPRYVRLLEQMQWPARQMQIFGIHVHVGVRSGEKAMAMVNALSGYIPEFLALSGIRHPDRTRMPAYRARCAWEPLNGDIALRRDRSNPAVSPEGRYRSESLTIIIGYCAFLTILSSMDLHLRYSMRNLQSCMRRCCTVRSCLSRSNRSCNMPTTLSGSAKSWNLTVLISTR